MPAHFGNERTICRLGAWNVRSVKNKETELIQEMERYNLDVLGVSKTRERGNRMTTINGASCMYAGVTEGRAKIGVGIVIAERWADCVKSWRCVNERCVTLRMKIAWVWLTLVQVYAPTDDRDNDIKDDFYSVLQEVLDRAPRGDKVVIIGDLNARVGNNVIRWEGVIRKQDEAVENDSGRKVTEF